MKALRQVRSSLRPALDPKWARIEGGGLIAGRVTPDTGSEVARETPRNWEGSRTHAMAAETQWKCQGLSAAVRARERVAIVSCAA